MKILQISAGGNGTRISDFMNSKSIFLPKHLLPLPTSNETILGEIVSRAVRHFDQINIWCNNKNNQDIIVAMKEFSVAHINIDQKMTGPLGPLLRELLSSNKRSFGCAGDFYCNFQWSEFEKFHDSHSLPISILIAKSVPAPKGARFNLQGKTINSWKRVKQTISSDYINIGCYIIDPVSDMLKEIKSMHRHKEDLFFDIFIKNQMVAGYDPQTIGFNINVAEIYKNLLSRLKKE